MVSLTYITLFVSIFAEIQSLSASVPEPKRLTIFKYNGKLVPVKTSVDLFQFQFIFLHCSHHMICVGVTRISTES